MDIAKHIKHLSGESDWPIWKRKIRDLLDYHEGAVDVIDLKLVQPKPVNENATTNEIRKHKEDCDLYRKANSYAKSMLTSSMTDEVYQKVMDKNTAYEMWEALKQQFEATSKDQLFKMCTDLFAFGWTPGEDVSTHLAKLRSLWNELNNGLKIKGEQELPNLLLVCKTLQILPKNFETFRSSWMLLTKDTEKTFDELTMQLCMFERNSKSRNIGENLSQEALVVRATNSRKFRKSKSRSKKEDICNYCKLKGHWLKDCYKWVADGKPSKESNQQSTSANANVALVSTCNEVNSIDEKFDAWWIDNGATKHVTNIRNCFIDFEEFQDSHSIQSAGKESLIALGKGTIEIVSQVGKDEQRMTLNDVWYVPEISRNLVSILAAHDRNLGSQFYSTSNKCWLMVNGKMVLQGTRQIGGSLFKAGIRVVPPKSTEISYVASQSQSEIQLYHERWGHQDKRHVKAMLEKQLGVKLKSDSELCEPCVFGKSHRLPFGTRKQTTKPGQLITTDLCGPFPESFSKKRYLLIFKDMFTKYRYHFLIREKSEAKYKLEEVLIHAKSLGHSIRELLSDNGGEFDNEDIRKIVSKYGVTQRLTAPYTPQQNGGSERANRTIIEMARTFKYSNSSIEFPEAIWAELVNSSVYILNRTGKSSIPGVSPYELWLKQKPRIKHLRIIGSVCYAHIPDQKRKKMDPKALKGYLVGYDTDERYRIFIKEKNKIIFSRDVRFAENHTDCRESLRLNMDEKLDSDEEHGKGSIINFPENAKASESEVDDESEDPATTLDSESEVDDELEDHTTSSHYGLRDRTTLRKPAHLQNFILSAEDLEMSDNPEDYEQATNLDNKCRAYWQKAMDDEMNSLNENQTWNLTPLPRGAAAIPSKWVFRLKKNPDGSIDRYKARLVIKGFKQRKGIDYNQTYSPVAKLSTIRSILSIAAMEKMHLAQFDVSTAFLYGKLEETIYMQQPEGYNDQTGRVCKLNKSLYGLKQAPRCWNKRFGGFLLSLGFQVSEADPCLYTRERNGMKLILVVYVDDGLVAASNLEELRRFLIELKQEFKVISKEANYYLGLEINSTSKGLKICQKAHVRKILDRFNFTDCKPVSTPILKAPEVQIAEKENVKQHNFPYRQAVGALMYLMLGTRPDLAYSVGFLSRSLENPSLEDVARLKRVFRYIAGTSDVGIEYQSGVSKGVLECFSDADFGGCIKTGRSTTGVVIKYAGGAVSWLSNRQAMVATSTTEAEIVAANEASKEIIWLSRLFRGIVKMGTIPVLMVDNAAAVRLANNPEFHRRTKHIAIKHFFIREKVSEGELAIEQISTEKQLADVMTKPLPRTRLVILSKELGLN